ncbi:MAG TPA: site-2 protease family protein [Rhizomicrobium sp.]|nr:site-2 protease family protein [Rhizomicrobium sp.]
MNGDLSGQILQIAIIAIPIIIAITFHEAAHGYVARLFGDETATRLGRVTFNPLKHIDLFGTIILPAFLLLTHAGFLFGYAKPVPVNFNHLRNPKRDMIWVAAAGPATNIMLALVSVALLALALHAGVAPKSWIVAALFGSVQINLVLAILNLLPLPPLDGGRVMTGLLPRPLAIRYARLERYGMLIILAALFLLPYIGEKLGMNLDIFDYLVMRPAAWAMHALFALIGLV